MKQSLVFQMKQPSKSDSACKSSNLFWETQLDECFHANLSVHITYFPVTSDCVATKCPGLSKVLTTDGCHRKSCICVVNLPIYFNYFGYCQYRAVSVVVTSSYFSYSVGPCIYLAIWNWIKCLIFELFNLKPSQVNFCSSDSPFTSQLHNAEHNCVISKLVLICGICGLLQS